MYALQHNYTDDMLVEDMLYELDEIDAQVDELEALFMTRVLTQRGRAGDAFEPTIYELKEDIGALRDELDDEARTHSWSLSRGRERVRRHAALQLERVQEAFRELRNNLLARA